MQNDQAMTTEEFLRKVVFAEANQKEAERRLNAHDGPMSTEEFVHQQFFGTPRPQKLPQLRPNFQPNQYVFQTQEFRGADNRIIGKAEQCCGAIKEFHYSYDAAGHLTDVWCDGQRVEKYAYNQQGQRLSADSVHNGEQSYTYAPSGALESVTTTTGTDHFHYTPAGSLQSRHTRHGMTLYEYGNDTRLDRVQLPNGSIISYTYANSHLHMTAGLQRMKAGQAGTTPVLGPVVKHINGQVTEEFIWRDAIRLAEWRDIPMQTRYVFQYNAEQRLAGMTVYQHGQSAAYRFGCDHLGTIKAVFDMHGNLIKEMTYDSFGNILTDSNPSLFIPLSFAGGLLDADTGFIRFGYRDYDPGTGRFTAKDPANDLRGDGDLWDYCVDDPINFVDPLGLARIGKRALDMPGGKQLFEMEKQGLRQDKSYDEYDPDQVDSFGGELADDPMFRDHNLHLYHEQIFLEDGSGETIGHGADPIEESKRKSEYLFDDTIYDAQTIREAAGTTPTGKYKPFTNNCQAYRARIVNKYNKLEGQSSSNPSSAKKTSDKK